MSRDNGGRTVPDLPRYETLELKLSDGVLQVTLNRPKVRNAMSLAMVFELDSMLSWIEKAPPDKVRVVLFRGAGGHFCSGGDIRDMTEALAADFDRKAGAKDPVAETNRRFGAIITRFDRIGQAVVAVLEGTVMGGGLGLCCVADVAIARADASFRLPETGLGIIPAQIAPFLVQRLGKSQARRLAVTGGRFDGTQAHAMGLVHHVCGDQAELDACIAQVLAQIRKCAPGAVAATKDLMNRAGTVEHELLLDEAADRFAAAVRGPEGQEGTMAFLQKRRPAWDSDQG